MSHRTLLILSVLLLAVGVVGIVCNKNETIVKTEIPPSSTKERKIQVAVANNALQLREILRAEDYKISTITIPAESTDNRDISSYSKGDISGFLIRNNVEAGSVLTAELLESPESPTFFQHAIKSDEIPYPLIINSIDSYLLSLLHSGDSISLYLRYSKGSEKKTGGGAVIQEVSGAMRSESEKKLDLIFSRLKVLEVKPVEKHNSIDAPFAGDEKKVGTIAVKVSTKQYAQLKVIEGKGELIIIPESPGQKLPSRIRVGNLLPVFSSIDELRGKN
ncbi:hypothetical protein D9980_16055 [Serratia sp. 3ACOL1]|uniref:hypothetical protein n=1 Tax=Serratia sp. 3ACOL1 TaxID=2448483 RepID=UPI000EF51DCF|nr:hypothetical protein [Serratia sp. 3ACOL1]AYM91962.1 hypothetical protein D9980_16055 [Serratia sp. 3ACOL1]